MWKLWHRLAYMLPRRLVYWATIRLAAEATTGQYNDTIVPELTVTEALRLWDRT